jgi:glycerol-3-phosphate dehydrogenase
VIRCGALLRPGSDAESETVARIAERARGNGVEVGLDADGVLVVPAEAVTDPAAYTLALAEAARAGGAEIRTCARVEAIERANGGLALRTADGASLTCSAAVNCAGLRGDEVARLVGDESFSVYPRKGEFFVFEPPDGEPLERILLPVPTARTKGVLVFPTVDGRVIAGPTAHDQVDKDDWSVRVEAFDEVMATARRMLPALEGAEPIAGYAGLRPAGRGCNYVIEPSRARPELINVAAIRSTGLTASLGIAEHVVSMLEAGGIPLGPERELGAAVPRDPGEEPWWQRASRRGALA